MKRDIVTSAIGIVVLTLLCGLVYPLFITGVSQVAFPGNANGQQIYVHGKLVGSKIIGQNFADAVINPKTGKVEMKNGAPLTSPDAHYFQSRPSATVPADNAAATTFSNLGPNNVATEREIATNVASYIALDKAPDGTPYHPGGLTRAQVPVDAANSSASGIDPEISIANADIQAYRISSVRHLSLSTVEHLISTYTLERGLGFSGEPGVDVLELNLALNRISPSTR
ncbi:MAG TPA: potassium-transporting ATPase subunit C [Solirubrobacteraceae bacterium]|jgi:K+-transporting ATPase ATPase C chain|nr:potassium-transporting ATPase subunit C [Solirubrobacteraceae bacterium]